MLINPKTNRRALWRYMLVLPIAAVLLMCSQKDAVESTMAPAQSRGAANDAVLKTPSATDEVFTVVEQNPEPQGGMAALGDYLRKNMRYPEAALKANIGGKVFVRFVVRKDGSITDVTVLRGIGFGTDEEAVRMVTQMPNWKPGLQNGKPVNVRFNLPIMFSLE